MRLRVLCPHCATPFEVEVPPAPIHPTPTRHPTARGLAAVAAPIREGAPTCSACGLVRALHEGEDNLAWARYGCDGFLER